MLFESFCTCNGVVINFHSSQFQRFSSYFSSYKSASMAAFGPKNGGFKQLRRFILPFIYSYFKLGCDVDKEKEQKNDSWRNVSLEWDKCSFAKSRCYFLQEVVNDQFSRIQDLKTEEEPDRVVQLINTYCTDVKKILLELKSYTDFPEVDYLNLEALVQEIEAKSSYIGAEQVRLACAGLIQACREVNMRKFVSALGWMRNEFECTQNKLEAVGQMERKIIRLERKQRK